MGLFARGGRLLGKRPGPTILLCGGFLFFMLVVSLLLLGALQPRCNSKTMPCVINEQGGCLCAARAADGTCWQRMEPALRCYRSTVVVKSGVCQGNYETRLCARSQDEIDLITDGLGTSTTELHPNNNGTCNMSYTLENSRCRFPQARQDAPGRAFVHGDCCRAPLQTCASDTDCCNCGQESQQCVARLRCLSTSFGDNGTVTSDSVECDASQDACVQYQYPGCRQDEELCTSPLARVPMDPTNPNSACCDSANPNLRCDCRQTCQATGEFPGCPCFQRKEGCFRRECVQTSLYFSEGGVEQFLRNQGARNIKLCYDDNCNQ
mmetsp:Transcript_55356/g.129548  ORF Transcript_55356/g.129548 Transcript_55356/m.129548 type:complete len:322 (-) Transcript_55356:13-978(-)